MKFNLELIKDNGKELSEKDIKLIKIELQKIIYDLSLMGGVSHDR